MLLSDATASNDDVNKCQLGEVLFEDSNGSKVTRIGRDRRRWVHAPQRRAGSAGKLAALPAVTKPGSGAASLVDLARSTMERLLAAPPEVLATLGRGFAAVVRDRRHSVPAAMATWPTAVQALAHSFTPLVPRGFAP